MHTLTASFIASGSVVSRTNGSFHSPHTVLTVSLNLALSPESFFTEIMSVLNFIPTLSKQRDAM